MTVILKIIITTITLAIAIPKREMDTILQEKIITASFGYPQLYNCIQVKDAGIQEPRSFAQSHEDTWLYEKIFSNLSLSEMLGSTFVEIGALDGIKYSNTFWFEKKYDWRGLLIEGHPENQKNLRQNAKIRSNSVIFTTAICQLNQFGHPRSVNFTARGGAVGAAIEQVNSKLLNEWHKGQESKDSLEVACVPIQWLFETTGMIDIDLFSLDVEGSELYVLKTIDFKVTNIRVIVVEANKADQAKDKEVDDFLRLHDFVNASLGSMKTACRPNEDCTTNEVYINPHYQVRKAKRLRKTLFNRYYQKDSGIACSNQKGINNPRNHSVSYNNETIFE